MGSRIDYLESKKLLLPAFYYGIRDWGTHMEVKTILEHPEVIYVLFSDYPMAGISNLDDYYFYLLSQKLAKLREINSILLKDEHKTIIDRISDYAEETIQSVNKGEVIKFINGNVKEILNKRNAILDIHEVTLEILADCNNGILEDILEYLCKNHGNLMIYNFDKFTKVFRAKPKLFSLIYQTGHFDEVQSLRWKKTLEIWSQIKQKEKGELAEMVEERIDVLTEDVKELCQTATVDNIIQSDGIIRDYYGFLKRIKSPKANEFRDYSRNASELLNKYLKEKGHTVEYTIPIGDIVRKWKTTKYWERRLICLTHDVKCDGGKIEFLSKLSKEPEEKRELVDLISTNITTNDYFTFSQQRMLSVIEHIEKSTIIEIIKEEDTRIEYLNLMASAIAFIIEQLDAEEEQIQQDTDMLLAIVQLVSTNIELNNDTMLGICYGAAMFMCAFSEKLMRILYFHVAKEEIYIPANNTTFGKMLSERNKYMVEIFGRSHIKNLSFFLQHDDQSDIGQNIRNDLAHWNGFSPNQMTPDFVCKMLWLFTDILNTVFGYCITKKIGEEENCDQL